MSKKECIAAITVIGITLDSLGILYNTKVMDIEMFIGLVLSGWMWIILASIAVSKGS